MPDQQHTPSDHATETVGTDRPRRLRLPSMPVQVVAAIVLGLALGLVTPTFAEHLEFLGEIFVRLITMSILPLVFPLIVLAIARMESARSLGRLAAKTLVYFEVVTTVILVITLGLALLTGIGKGADLSSSIAADSSGVAKSVDVGDYLLGIVPDNVVGAFADDNLLAVIFFGAVFGFALGRLGDGGAPVVDFLDVVAQVMFKVIGWVVRLSPIAVFSFVAYSTAFYGWDVLGKLALFVIVFYVAAALVMLVVFPLVGLVFGVPYPAMVRKTGDLLLLAFVTRSSEAVLAPLIERLDEFGVPSRISSFTLPLGYSFNADGATMYEGLAVVFLAHAYGVDLSFGKLVGVVLLLMLLTKGVAGVPSAAIVILFSAAHAIGLPAQGVAILLAVDFVVDMARTGVNVTGNSLASLVVSKSEGVFADRGTRERPAVGATR